MPVQSPWCRQVAVSKLCLIDPSWGESQEVSLAELLDAAVDGAGGAVEGGEEGAEAGQPEQEVVHHRMHDALLAQENLWRCAN